MRAAVEVASTDEEVAVAAGTMACKTTGTRLDVLDTAAEARPDGKQSTEIIASEVAIWTT